jgi:hypothetical protein
VGFFAILSAFLGLYLQTVWLSENCINERVVGRHLEANRVVDIEI